MPGAFILAHSREVFNLPSDISAEYKLKSSMARIGLNHLNAGWCDSFWSGSVLTLELHNTTQNHAIQLRMGDPIGQMVFFRHAPVPEESSYKVRGRYNNDKTVSGIKE
jgi:deoxycytidine triphosphate deaminase